MPSEQDSQIRVGAIGLGAMGNAMAQHLAWAGLLECVWNRTPSRARQFAGRNAVRVAQDPADLANSCNVILSCVSADADLLQVLAQILPSIRPGSVMVDTSTVNPTTARQVAEKLARVGCGFVDAPVSGGVEGAKNGTLSVMAGGDFANISRLTPVLESFSATVTHMGPVGSGQATKAVNQVMIAGIAEAVCEALALAEQLKLPAERLLAVVGAGAAGSWFLDHRGKTMLEDNFAGGFKLSLLLKDLKICQVLARGLDIPTPIVDAAVKDYQRLNDAGDGDNEISGLIRLKRNAGELQPPG